MPKCQGCLKKRKHKKLLVWEGLFGNLLLCHKCEVDALLFNHLNEEASFQIIMEDRDDDF